MADKIDKLWFMGEYDSDGNPREYWGVVPETGESVPARDLDADDIGRLSPRTVTIITGPRAGGRPALYAKTKPGVVVAPEVTRMADKPEKKD